VHIREGLLPETNRILQGLATPLNLPQQDLKVHVTPEEFISTYKVVQEQTSSSPSGRHVGHYKAILDDPQLVSLHAGILLARQLGFQLEDNRLVSEMQFGSRPGKQCVSAILHKQLTFDIVRHSKETAAFIENDAIGCYDRMVNSILILAMRRLGIPSSATTSLASTWENAVHHIKTRYRVSETSYKNNAEIPLFGPGQDSTLGPFLWLLCFCLIVDPIDTSLQRIKFSSVNNPHQVTELGMSFVDDVSLGCSKTVQDDETLSFEGNLKAKEKDMIKKLTNLSQHWERLLYSTGGGINLQKSHWVLMSWKWKNGEAYLTDSGSAPGKLCLTSGHDLENPIEVPRLESRDTYRTLGAHISPSDKTSKTVGILKEKSNTYAMLIANSTLTHQETYWVFTLFFRPQLTFCLGALFFTGKRVRPDSGTSLTSDSL
jgi:hypothetical protein